MVNQWLIGRWPTFTTKKQVDMGTPVVQGFQDPIASMYGIFTYIYHKNQPNVGKYTIHGWYGDVCLFVSFA